MGELRREVRDGVMLCGRRDAVGLLEEPMPIQTTATVDNDAGLGWEGEEKVERLVVGRRQRAGGVLAIGKIEVTPQPRDHVGTGVGTPTIGGGLTLWPLQAHPKVQGVILAEPGCNRCGMFERRLGEIQPLGLEPALPRLGMDMGRIGIGPGEDQPAGVNVRIEEFKEVLNLGLRRRVSGL
jgi:hypothetical protein